MIARTLNAAFNMSKWRMLVHREPPTKVWLQIFTIYKIALKQKLLSSPIELFPLSPPTTLSAFVVQIAMLGQLSQANMHKPHIEIAAKLLVTWLTHAHISDKYTMEQYIFYIDLERDFPAKRMRNLVPNSDCRYWEMDDLEKQIDIAITVSDRGEVPESLIVSKIENLKHLNETLSILQAEWRKKDYIRQRRRETREATSKTAKVNAGIDDICNQILQANQINKGIRLSKSGKTLDELLRGHTVLKQASNLTLNSSSLDTWIITDQSSFGLGARVNKYASITARPDKLIGLVIDGEPGNVLIGMIKGVKPTQGNQLKVGIEIVSRQAVWIQLQQTQEKKVTSKLPTSAEISSTHLNSQHNTGLFSGIYLPKEEGFSEEASLLLPKMNFQPNALYTIHISGKSKRIKLDTATESQDDWIKVAVSF